MATQKEAKEIIEILIDISYGMNLSFKQHKYLRTRLYQWIHKNSKMDVLTTLRYSIKYISKFS